MNKNQIAGFTGTQKGMTMAQRETFKEVIETIRPRELHHGDCVGADYEAHNIAVTCGVPVSNIIKHPSNLSQKRAYCIGGIALKEKAPLDRNKDIVDAVEILVATPSQAKEMLRSGTWATVRRAQDANKPVIIINPDGSISRREP